MKTFLILLQILSGIVLIITVLLHSAKGEGLGGIGGHKYLHFRKFFSLKNIKI